ncbi:MAG: RnfABCDGE type electron transport complex subunit B [Casimicrobiaceae bacterium]
MDAFAELADRIDDVLPQTQCRRCGYAGCRPYAEAIAAGDADMNRCPPGGAPTLDALATLLGRVATPLDTSRGSPGPLHVARIDESACIGCTLCIAACPVDAIIGAPKRLHGVLAELCSGCELCLPSCPVDCIVMLPGERAWTGDDARAARARFEARTARQAHATSARAPAVDPADRRAQAIAAALARAHARRSESRNGKPRAP